ncbi:MAG TPA: hypothetical protein VGJ28_04720 [Micromonosporaceae bacterium]
MYITVGYLAHTRDDWQSGHVIVNHVIVLATGVGGNKGPNHVPGVVITGVVVGILLMWAAIRTMFGKQK